MAAYIVALGFCWNRRTNSIGLAHKAKPNSPTNSLEHIKRLRITQKTITKQSKIIMHKFQINNNPSITSHISYLPHPILRTCLQHRNSNLNLFLWYFMFVSLLLHAS